MKGANSSRFQYSFLLVVSAMALAAQALVR